MSKTFKKEAEHQEDLVEEMTKAHRKLSDGSESWRSATRDRGGNDGGQPHRTPPSLLLGPGACPPNSKSL